MNIALLRNKQLFIIAMLVVLTLIALVLVTATMTNSFSFLSDTAVAYPHP